MEQKIEKQNLLSLGILIDSPYLDLYVNLINEASNTFGEKHHIVPKSYYKMNSLKIDNSPKNLVLLNRVEHILAHYYLYKCSVNSKFKSDNAYAVICLTRTSNINDAKKIIYNEKFLDEFNNIVNQHNKEISILLKGKKKTIEHKNKISKTRILNGYSLGENNPMFGVHRLGVDSPNYNRQWYHKGNERHMILPDEVTYYINLGYVKGKGQTKKN